MSKMLKMMERLPGDAVYSSVESPVGRLRLVASKKGLHALFWEREANRPDYRRIFSNLKRNDRHGILLKTKKQLREYFSGKRRSFQIPLVLDGTPFQKRAWAQLSKIPYGKTVSYQEQARKVGDPNRARAVGTANSKNPISIVVPCHRVISKDGGLGGFGGGLARKRILLNLEKRF